MERLLTYGEAIREATEQAMTADPCVIVMGMGVDDPKAIYGTTEGLVEKFGQERVFDTPLSEDGMTGVAIGAALGGLRPIHVHIRMDFALLAMNQLINMGAKMRYMYGGTICVPMVVRLIIGRSWGQGPQHSQALHSFFMHIPGLKVFAPTTPYDAKGCLMESIRDDNPVIFVEHRLLQQQKGYVPEAPYTVSCGKARTLAEGEDITLVGICHMVVECLRARRFLKEVGVSVEVIDPVSLSPLDMGAVIESVRKTGRLLVIDNAWTSDQIHAFTVSFPDEPEYDKDAIACQTASRLGVAYHSYAVDKATALQWAQQGLEQMDQPTMDGLNTYIVSRAVRDQGLVVALSGQGGDEIFGGYRSFRGVPSWLRRMSWLRPLPASWRAGLAGVATLGMDSVVREKAGDIARTGSDLLGIYFHYRRLLSDNDLAGRGLKASDLGLTRSFQLPSRNGSRYLLAQDPIASVSRLESVFYLGNTLLRDGDVFGMANSLEIRVPFLDRDLVEWAFQLPGVVLLPRGAPNKPLLRQMCARVL